MSDDRSNTQANFGLSDLIVWARAYWLPIVLPVVVSVVLGAIYSLAATPKYEVETLLAPQDTSTSNQMLGQLGSQLGAIGLGRLLSPGGGSQADVSAAILQSRRFLGEFITAHDLLPSLFASRWDEKSGTWDDDGNPPPTVNDAYRKMKRNILLVDKDEVTGFVTVSLRWKDPQVAHKWLVALIDDLNQSVRQRERDEATKSLRFLQEELQRTDLMDLQQALHQLSLAELQRLTLANVRDDFAFKIIDPPNLPDEDDPIWPKPLLILLSSAFMGLFLGLALAVLLTAMRAAFGRT